MKPIDFKGTNVVFAKNQPEYLPLPAVRTEDGIVTTCWEASFKERLKFLFRGKLWLQLMTFNHPLQPILPSIDKP